MYLPRIRQKLPRVRERIEAARSRGGGSDHVSIVAVTKGHPLEAVEAAMEAGIRDVGENRVQELEEKVAAWETGTHASKMRWHLVGHLQRNKVRRALPLFGLIHSIDSSRLARELSKEALKAGVEVEGLVQVNTAGEAAKHGLEGAVVEEVAGIVELPGVVITGLMTMAPLAGDESVLRETFRRARELFEECDRQIPDFRARHLSMGMSQDFEIAVEEGSTMVRLGTILMGERDR